MSALTAWKGERKGVLQPVLEPLTRGWEHWRERLRRWRSARGNGAAAMRRAAEPVWHDEYAGDPPAPRSLPSAEVRDEGPRFVVRLETPGLRRDELSIELHGGLLAVQGERRTERRERRGGYEVIESRRGQFRRVFALPSQVDVDQVRARYRDGVLRIELPKRAGTVGRRIEVRAG